LLKKLIFGLLMKYVLNKNDIINFNKNGYIKLNNVVSINQLSLIKSTIKNIASKYIVLDKLENDNNLNDVYFNNQLIDLRKKNREKFSSFYDTLQSSVALKKIISSSRILDCVESLLKLNKEDLAASGETIRLDPPSDDRNSYDWHQERSYYPNNRNGKNGIFCWAPLHDVSKKMGALVVCPKSHKERFVVNKKQQRIGKGSIDIKVPDNLIKKYQDKKIPIKAGSIIFSHLHLFHKSGNNLSNKFRFSFVARYHNAASKDYLPGMKINTKWNNYDIEKFKLLGDDLSDL
tara:strand:+ start:5555 stop:6424 length:870 start_codon:yes stop_codon:yes gene_type:complete